MPDRLEIRTTTLRAAAGGTDEVASALERGVQELASSLRRVGACWGDDEPGHAFASSYEPAADSLLEHLSGFVHGLGSIADGLRSMADDFDAAEGASRIAGGR